MRRTRRTCPKCLARVKGDDTCRACGHQLAPLGSEYGERQLPDWADVLPAPAAGDEEPAVPDTSR